jgi:hypothetical protein
MTARTARLWAVLAALGAVTAAALDGTALASAAAGALCVLLAGFLVSLDGLRKRGRTRR